MLGAVSYVVNPHQPFTILGVYDVITLSPPSGYSVTNLALSPMTTVRASLMGILPSINSLAVIIQNSTMTKHRASDFWLLQELH